MLLIVANNYHNMGSMLLLAANNYHNMVDDSRYEDNKISIEERPIHIGVDMS
jgi:hypothetical protein